MKNSTVRHQTSPSKHLHMRLDELLPRRRATPLRCWGDVVSPQDVTDRLVRDLMPQIGQRAHNTVISPTSVLARKTDYQFLHFRGDPRAPGIATLPRSIELPRHQLPIPTENSVRLGDLCDILQSFASESLSDLGQGGTLRIRQPEPR